MQTRQPYGNIPSGSRNPSKPSVTFFPLETKDTDGALYYMIST
jgi:hypothetical protein